jgi:glutathione S-transferase
MSIRLYSWPTSSASGSRWALEELGAPYEYVVLDGAKREHRTPEYLAINPNGKVPTLVDDGQPYFESLAILLHLAERHGQTRGLWPSGGAASAEALCWTVWGTAELRPYTMQWVYHGLDTPVSYAPKDRSKATADYNHGEYQRLLDMLDARLAGRDYLLGDFSLVDVSPASVLLFATKLGATVEGRVNVEAWLARCKARPARERAGD